MTDHLLDRLIALDLRGDVEPLRRWPRPGPRLAAVGAGGDEGVALAPILGQLNLRCVVPVGWDAGPPPSGPHGDADVARRRALEAAEVLGAPVGVGIDGDVVVLVDPEGGLELAARSSDLRCAARQVVDDARRRCPRCDRPGFAVDRHETGLACLRCGTPTSQVRAEVRRCDGCDHEQAVRAPLDADPAACPRCTP